MGHMSKLKWWILLFAAFLTGCDSVNGSEEQQNIRFTLFEGRLDTRVTIDPFGALLAVPKSVSVIKDQQVQDKLLQRLGVIEDDKISGVVVDFSSQQSVLITLGKLSQVSGFGSMQVSQINETEDFVVLQTDLVLLKSTTSCTVTSAFLPVYLVVVDTIKPLVIKENVIINDATC